MSLNIHEKFFESAWRNAGSKSTADLAAEYMTALVKQMDAEIQEALPERDGKWKATTEVVIESAFGEKIELAECQEQMGRIMSANRARIKEMCEREVKTAPKDRARYLRARYWANELCYVINRNRPTVQKVIELMKKEN